MVAPRVVVVTVTTRIWHQCYSRLSVVPLVMYEAVRLIYYKKCQVKAFQHIETSLTPSTLKLFNTRECVENVLIKMCSKCVHMTLDFRIHTNKTILICNLVPLFTKLFMIYIFHTKCYGGDTLELLYLISANNLLGIYLFRPLFSTANSYLWRNIVNSC